MDHFEWICVYTSNCLPHHIWKNAVRELVTVSTQISVSLKHLPSPPPVGQVHFEIIDHCDIFIHIGILVDSFWNRRQLSLFIPGKHVLESFSYETNIQLDTVSVCVHVCGNVDEPGRLNPACASEHFCFAVE